MCLKNWEDTYFFTPKSDHLKSDPSISTFGHRPSKVWFVFFASGNVGEKKSLLNKSTKQVYYVTKLKITDVCCLFVCLFISHYLMLQNGITLHLSKKNMFYQLKKSQGHDWYHVLPHQRDSNPISSTKTPSRACPEAHRSSCWYFISIQDLPRVVLGRKRSSGRVETGRGEWEGFMADL